MPVAAPEELSPGAPRKLSVDAAARRHRLAAVRSYLIVSAAGHIAWETAQLPLYTIWEEGTTRQIAFALLHCTGGDVLIAIAALLAALLLVGSRAWTTGPVTAFGAVVIGTGVAYAILSEWWNVEVVRSWAYADPMPRLPWLGTGVSPLLQWVVVPAAALWWARRAARSAARARFAGKPSVHRELAHCGTARRSDRLADP